MPEKATIGVEVEVKDVPARRVALTRELVPLDEMKHVVPRNIDAVAHAIGKRHAGPPFCRCPFPDAEGRIATEIGWPVPDDVEVTPPVEVLTYPATRALLMKHIGPYEELGRTYRLMSEAIEEHGLRPAGAPVEWYESDPEEVPDPKDYVTVIEWPIGPEGEV